LTSKWEQRGNRGAMVRVALVGYTNVGKSTLMNAIGKVMFCRKLLRLWTPFEKW
jgi:50S ribosomal subunit-associated GTPase HflX